MEPGETAGSTIRLIIDEMRRERGEAGVRQMLARAGETRRPDVLSEEGAWHSFELRRRLFEAGCEVAGDDQFPFRVGASVLAGGRDTFLRGLLRRVGSPAGLLRALPALHAKFDAACETRLRERRKGYGLLEFRTKAPHTPNRHDCGYAMGLLSQLSVLFGMPPATVRQTQCQAEGADCCLLEARWHEKRAQKPPSTVETPAVDPDELRQLQLNELQQAVGELLEAADVAQVLGRIAQHAQMAVAAKRLLVAVRPEGEGGVLVAAEGFEGELARSLAERLLDGDEGALLGAPSGEAERQFLIVAEIGSPARPYGKLVAFSSAPFLEEERELLCSYAKLASGALEKAIALEMAAAGRRTAEALGAFAARLLREDGAKGIAEATVRAAAELVSADRAVVYAFDEETRTLRTLGHAGFPPELAGIVESQVVSPAETPEMEALLRSPDSTGIFARPVGDSYVETVMDLFGVRSCCVVPIRTGKRIYGVLAAAFVSEDPPSGDTVARLSNLADQAAGAWEKAILLELVNKQSATDPLTGLANRRTFTEILAGRLSSGRGRLAVVFCDVDRFKAVNDAIGHALGDELLAEVGRRLGHCVRSDDVVARLGGDEFTLLLSSVDDDEWNPELFAAAARDVIGAPVPVGGSKIVVRFSMGAVVVEPGEMSVKDILIRGDAAVRAAKVRGGDRLLRFSEEMLSERSDRLEIEESLVEAAADPEQFLVMYQAQIDMASGEVVGAEALLRWRHPARGLLHPDRFLEVAEETGLIVPIDFHVLRTALGELARFRQKGLSVRMGVNFSARTLAEPDLVASVSEALAEADVPGDLLEIEMTESAAVHDPEALGAVLEGLGELGVSVAVDDVGTGYASLALLHKLPARRLKIDRSFVQRITEDQAARSVVEAVLLLADRLGQSVVAEGIESKEQALELRSLGCRLAQGFLFSPPSSAAVVEQLARTGIRLPGSRLLFDKTHAGEGPPLNGSPQAGDAPYEGAPRRAATQRARHRRKRGQ